MMAGGTFLSSLLFFQNGAHFLGHSMSSIGAEITLGKKKIGARNNLKVSQLAPQWRMNSSY